MFKHAWSVVAASSVINKDDNSLSLFNVFEGIDVEIKEAEAIKALEKGEKIAINMPHEIVSYIYREDSSSEQTVTIRINFKGPTGKSATISEHKIVFDTGKQNMRARVKAAGFAISRSGRYFYEVSIVDSSGKAKLVSSLPLSINMKPRQDA